MDPDWNSTCSRSSQEQNPPRNRVGRGKSEERWESGSNGCSARRKTRKWSSLLFLSHIHTHKPHSPSCTPHAETELPLHADEYPGKGRHTAGGGGGTVRGVREPRMRPGTCPWASTSARLALLSLRATRLCRREPPRTAGSGTRTSTGAAPSRPAGDVGLRGTRFPSSLRAMEAPVSLPRSRPGSAPGGTSKSSARKA